MKVKNVKVLVASVVLFAVASMPLFSQSSSAKKLVSSGKSSEKAGKFVEALGAYYDAYVIEDDVKGEAYSNLSRLSKSIRSGKPGYFEGKYLSDDDVQKKWLSLLKETDAYWCSKMPYSVELTKLEKSRSGSCRMKLYFKETEKFSYMLTVITTGYSKAYSDQWGSEMPDIDLYGNIWQEGGAYQTNGSADFWPLIAASKARGSEEEVTVYYSERSGGKANYYSQGYKLNRNNDDYNVGGSLLYGTADSDGGYLKGSSKYQDSFVVTAFYNPWAVVSRADFTGSTRLLYDVKIALVDSNGNQVVSGKTFSPYRDGKSEKGDKYYIEYSGLDSSQMKQVESGKVFPQVVSINLRYGFQSNEDHQAWMNDRSVSINAFRKNLAAYKIDVADVQVNYDGKPLKSVAVKPGSGEDDKKTVTKPEPVKPDTGTDDRKTVTKPEPVKPDSGTDDRKTVVKPEPVKPEAPKTESTKTKKTFTIDPTLKKILSLYPGSQPVYLVSDDGCWILKKYDFKDSIKDKKYREYFYKATKEDVMNAFSANNWLDPYDDSVDAEGRSEGFRELTKKEAEKFAKRGLSSSDYIISFTSYDDSRKLSIKNETNSLVKKYISDTNTKIDRIKKYLNVSVADLEKDMESLTTIYNGPSQYDKSLKYMAVSQKWSSQISEWTKKCDKLDKDLENAEKTYQSYLSRYNKAVSQVGESDAGLKSVKGKLDAYKAAKNRTKEDLLSAYSALKAEEKNLRQAESKIAEADRAKAEAEAQRQRELREQKEREQKEKELKAQKEKEQKEKELKAQKEKEQKEKEQREQEQKTTDKKTDDKKTGTDKGTQAKSSVTMKEAQEFYKKCGNDFEMVKTMLGDDVKKYSSMKEYEKKLNGLKTAIESKEEAKVLAAYNELLNASYSDAVLAAKKKVAVAKDEAVQVSQDLKAARASFDRNKKYVAENSIYASRVAETEAKLKELEAAFGKKISVVDAVAKKSEVENLKVDELFNLCKNELFVILMKEAGIELTKKDTVIDVWYTKNGKETSKKYYQGEVQIFYVSIIEKSGASKMKVLRENDIIVLSTDKTSMSATVKETGNDEHIPNLAEYLDLLLEGKKNKEQKIYFFQMRKGNYDAHVETLKL